MLKLKEAFVRWMALSTAFLLVDARIPRLRCCTDGSRLMTALGGHCTVPLVLIVWAELVVRSNDATKKVACSASRATILLSIDWAIKSHQGRSSMSLARQASLFCYFIYLFRKPELFLYGSTSYCNNRQLQLSKVKVTQKLAHDAGNRCPNRQERFDSDRFGTE